MLGQDSHHEESGRVGEPEIRPEDSARWRAMEKWATDFIGQQRKELNRMVRITVEPVCPAPELARACLVVACGKGSIPCRGFRGSVLIRCVFAIL